MKVYVLTLLTAYEGDQLLFIGSKPKRCKEYVEERDGIDTRKKWKKNSFGERYFVRNNLQDYCITEWKVDD